MRKIPIQSLIIPIPNHWQKPIILLNNVKEDPKNLHYTFVFFSNFSWLNNLDFLRSMFLCLLDAVYSLRLVYSICVSSVCCVEFLIFILFRILTIYLNSIMFEQKASMCCAYSYKKGHKNKKMTGTHILSIPEVMP